MALNLTELVNIFIDEYAAAPQFKGYSQALRQSIRPKSQVQSEFISNLQMLKIVSDDQAVCDKIDKILKKYE